MTKEEIQNKIDEIITQFFEMNKEFMQQMDEFHTADALNISSKVCAICDKFLTSSQPWKLYSESKKEEGDMILAFEVNALLFMSYLKWPFFPDKMNELAKSVGIPDIGELEYSKCTTPEEFRDTFLYKAEVIRKRIMIEKSMAEMKGMISELKGLSKEDLENKFNIAMFNKQKEYAK